MGCFQSKHRIPDEAKNIEGKALLVTDLIVDDSTALLLDYDSELVKGLPPVSPTNLLLLDYAQRMAEEIVALAVRQWDELDRQYRDIPYIDSDMTSAAET
ncbi:small membrane A-kinase anchor protein-like [Alosa alosa]|uniref:small membrane A-kinase anchor protein-like n=1 Tax=Alosa sapidissima TaxID=34773 RepID=UPI001C08BD0C|nr:small membrane A-kinase anchor protein-like [Alosa sapidissima]XP_048091648.1 small membrane A-kinase anchor protein-like [Alosa alosa]